MTSLANWMPADVMQALGWALMHFLWQGLAIAAIASVAMAVSRSARIRYGLAVGALILMAAAPLGTFYMELRAESEAANALSVSAAMAAGDGHTTSSQLATPSASATAAAATSQKIGATNLKLPPGILLLLVEAWFAGVIFFSLRYAGGMVLIERLRRNDAKPVSAILLEKCKALQVSLGLDRVIRYCECYRIDAPAVIGWFRPVVLLPAEILTGLTEEQLTAVIAHELAHIQRLDSFVNLFQVAAETFLFYHPAIWWVNKRIRVERENCCDDAAISVCGDALEYARALTLLAERRAAPSLAMALNRSPLEARVMRLLGIGDFRGGIRTVGFAASFLCLAGAVFAGNAFLNNAGKSIATVDASRAPQQVRKDFAGVTEARVKTLAASAAHSNVHSAVQTVMHSEWVAAVAQTQATASSNGANQEAAAQETKDATQSAKESYIDSLKAAGLQNLDVDDIVALKIQGVTADYVRTMIALKLKIDAETLVGMKVQGITPEYVKSIRDMGLQADADALIALKVQGITQDYVREMRAAGLDGDADAFIAMKVQSITPEYAKEMRDLGLKLNSDDLVAVRVQHVTPEYIRGIRATGLNPSGDELIGLKVQGVTPEYVKALQAAGLKDLNADDIIAAKVQGITPEFIEQARKHGFKDLDLEKLLALKRADVF
jgi:beta-lactamase regulating signal transducer with metallopeptidase domain